jgi:hypothetical protein
LKQVVVNHNSRIISLVEVTIEKSMELESEAHQQSWFVNHIIYDLDF